MNRRMALPSALCLLTLTATASAEESVRPCQTPVVVQGILLRLCPDDGLWVGTADGSGLWVRWTDSATVTDLVQVGGGATLVLSGDRAPTPDVEGAPPPRAPPAPPSRPGGGREIEVTALDQSRLLVRIDKGRRDGIFAGMPIVFEGPDGTETSGVVGSVKWAWSDQAEVQVGLQERVPTGTRGRPDPRAVPTRRSIVAPPRAAKVFVASTRGGPFLNGGQQSFGFLAFADLGYRFQGPFAVTAELDPLVISGRSADDSYLMALGGRVIAEWDTWLFGAGIGLGASTYNDVDGDPFFDRSTANVDTVVPTFALRLRAGSRDGLSLQATGSFLAEREVLPADLAVRLGIPLSGAVLLRLNGQGGRTGYIGFDAELRILASGNGGPGSFFLSFASGAGAVRYDERCQEEACDFFSQETGGGMFGVGMEVRL